MLPLAHRCRVPYWFNNKIMPTPYTRKRKLCFVLRYYCIYNPSVIELNKKTENAETDFYAVTVHENLSNQTSLYRWGARRKHLN